MIVTLAGVGGATAGAAVANDLDANTILTGLLVVITGVLVHTTGGYAASTKQMVDVMAAAYSAEESERRRRRSEEAVRSTLEILEDVYRTTERKGAGSLTAPVCWQLGQDLASRLPWLTDDDLRNRAKACHGAAIQFGVDDPTLFGDRGSTALRFRRLIEEVVRSLHAAALGDDLPLWPDDFPYAGEGQAWIVRQAAESRKT